MVRGEAFPFNDFSRATPGQLTWVYLNQLIDYDERIRKIHLHCLPKFHRDTCEVCGDPVIDVRKLPSDIQDKVYVPSRDGEIPDVELGKDGGVVVEPSPPTEMEIEV
jgi:hypothetical protein